MQTMRCPIRLSGDAREDIWVDAVGRWPLHHWPFAPLRVCSHCGGFHPEDVVRLMRDHGYHGIPGGPEGKLFLVPPGMVEHEIARQAGAVLPASIKGPPAKTYLQHFDPEAGAALMCAIMVREATRSSRVKQ